MFSFMILASFMAYSPFRALWSQNDNRTNRSCRISLSNSCPLPHKAGIIGEFFRYLYRDLVFYKLFRTDITLAGEMDQQGLGENWN